MYCRTQSSIDVLDLPKELKAALKRMALFTVGRLREKTRDFLEQHPDIGRANASKIAASLDPYGFSLARF